MKEESGVLTKILVLPVRTAMPSAVARARRSGRSARLARRPPDTHHLGLVRRRVHMNLRSSSDPRPRRRGRLQGERPDEWIIT
jgi:hypothetical protein